MVHEIRLTSFLWLWFQCVCPLMPSGNTYRLGFLLPWTWGISSWLLQHIKLIKISKFFNLIIPLLKILLNTNDQSKLNRFFPCQFFSFLTTFKIIECLHILLHPFNLSYMKQQLPQSSAWRTLLLPHKDIKSVTTEPAVPPLLEEEIILPAFYPNISRLLSL